MENIIMGVDIGGSHITSALIDLDQKKEVEKTWFRTRLNSSLKANEIIDLWAITIEKSLGNYDRKSERFFISIAMPGPMDYTNGICKIKDQDKYDALFGVNIKKQLAKRLGINQNRLFFTNDAVCFLKGELFNGSLFGFDKAIGLTLGTGLGTSHTKDGKAYDSELWKMPFLKGIAEDYISTRWFVNRFEELTGNKIKDVKDLVDNHQGSAYFKSIFTEFSINLAKFIHKFIRKKMPLAAVIGGNVVLAENFFLDDTRKYLSQMMGYSFPIKCSTLGEKAALYGAGSILNLKPTKHA